VLEVVQKNTVQDIMMEQYWPIEIIIPDMIWIQANIHVLVIALTIAMDISEDITTRQTS
jgi:hypothetical protein